MGRIGFRHATATSMNPTNEHQGRVAVVTGGSGSIGGAIAKRLVSEGAFVHALDINDASRPGTDAVARIKFHKVDVGNEPNIDQVFDEISKVSGKIDYLVCCAAIDSRRPFLELGLDDWRRTLQINLTGSFLCCRAAARIMRPRKFGRIVMFSSMVARTGAAEGAHFSASKGGVLGFARAFAVETAADNIRVNTISPGITATAQPRSLVSNADVEARQARIPLGRIGDAHDMTEACMFLLSEESSYVVCQDIRVNGGASLW